MGSVGLVGGVGEQGNMKGTCVNKSNAKCSENGYQSLHSKGNPHSRQRLIFIHGNGVFLSSEGFEIHFQSI